MFDLFPLSHVDAGGVEALLDRAFGPERHVRTAYKVRGAAPMIAELSFAAIDQDALVGSVQCWPVAFTSDADGRLPMVMLGPVAVEPMRQHQGIGRLLMERVLDAGADRSASDALMLIGDPGYYGRFGFDASRTGRWRLPGPVDRHRLLARGDAVPNLAGMLGPALVPQG